MPNCISALVSFALLFPFSISFEDVLMCFLFQFHFFMCPLVASALHSRPLFIVFAFVMPSRNQFTFAAVPIPLTRGPFPHSFSFAPPSMSCFRFRASNCHRSTYMIQCHSIENSIDSSSSRCSYVLPQSLESDSAPSRSHT